MNRELVFQESRRVSLVLQAAGRGPVGHMSGRRDRHLQPVRVPRQGPGESEELGGTQVLALEVECEHARVEVPLQVQRDRRAVLYLADVDRVAAPDELEGVGAGIHERAGEGNETDRHV